VQALFEVKNILNRLRAQYKPIIQAGLKPDVTKVYNTIPISSDIKYPGTQFLENSKNMIDLLIFLLKLFS